MDLTQAVSAANLPHIRNRIRLIDHTVDLLQTVQVHDRDSRWYGGFLDPLRLVAEPWYAAGAVDVMVAALVEPDSRYYRSEKIAESVALAMDYVLRNQYPNGTIDAYFVGDMQAAPNAAFVARMLCRAYRKLKGSASLPVDPSVLDSIAKFLVRAGEGIRKRQAYTSNHRWVIAEALLQIDALFPDPALRERAEAYLSEGIDINSDGMYSERSTSYGMLTNDTLISIAELTGRREYLELVRRNLEFVLYLVQPNGEDTYQFSTRQDAVIPGTRITGEDIFRYMAAYTGDGRFATMTDYIAAQGLTDDSVADLIARERDSWQTVVPDRELVFPSLKHSILSRITARGQLLSERAYVDISHIERSPLPAEYHRYFETSRLVRIRRAGVAASLMGMQPNFFSLHAGEAVIEGIRIRYLYHNWKSFRPQRMTRIHGGYELWGSHDSNPEQPKFAEDDDLTLRVRLYESGNNWTIEVDVEGQPMVPVQVEIAARPTGQIYIGDTQIDPQSAQYAFVRGDVSLSSGKQRIMIRGLPCPEHRIIDHTGGWLGNIPFKPLYATAFSPCNLKFEISVEGSG